MIDPRIPLQVEGPPDPLQRMGQIMGLRQQRREGQRQETRFAAEQREQQEQEAVRAVIQKYGGFTEEAIQEIATINPEAAIGLQQLIQQGQITALNLKKAQQPEPPPTPEWIETEGPEGEAGRLYDVPEPGRFYRKPVPGDKPPAEPTTFDADILAAKRSGDPQRLKDAIALKRQAEAAGRGPIASPQPSYVWAVPPGETAARRMTEEEARRLRATQPPTASSGLGAAPIQLRNQRTAAALNGVERLKKLAPVREPGPLGIAQGIGEVAKGYAGYSTKTRQFQALIQPTAMQMAVAVQGAANLSDTERKVMAEMLGSINTMDYESQMALLDSAVELLKNSADVEKVGTVWRVRGRAPQAAQEAPGMKVKMLDPRGRPLEVPFEKVEELEALGATVVR